MILVGDIGGTNTRLALCKVVDGHVKLVVYDRFPSRGYANLEEIVRAFVSAHNLDITHACFGVAGPVKHGRCTATNLAWVVDAQQLAAAVASRDVENRIHHAPGLPGSDFLYDARLKALCITYTYL
jgi:glucokinase